MLTESWTHNEFWWRRESGGNWLCARSKLRRPVEKASELLDVDLALSPSLQHFFVRTRLSLNENADLADSMRRGGL